MISAKSIINRSEPISAVNYKKEFSYLYDCHTYSQLAEKLGFSRQRYVNLAALPSWQRNYKISKMLKDSFKDYKRLEITLKGYVESELYSALITAVNLVILMIICFLRRFIPLMKTLSKQSLF